MSESNIPNNEDKFSLKNAFNKVKNWIAFALLLFVAIVGIVLTQVNNSLSKANNPAIVVIPWWIWIIVGGFFIILGISITLIVKISYEHHCIRHNKGGDCDTRIETLCTACDSIPEGIKEKFETVCNQCAEMREKQSAACKDAIECMNQKIKEQESYLSTVDNLVSNAKDLERLYSVAVAERLRTNKQVIEIESGAKTNTEIYMMTSSFLFERYDTDMRNTIVSNINKGVKYRYIIPNGSENEFNMMVYAIFADDKLKPKYKNCEKNNFLTATKLIKEYFMLTIGYYDLQSKELSEVIVKLPADNLDELSQEKPLTYLVPKGNENGKNYKQHPEHNTFLDNLKKLYNIGERENGGVIAHTKSNLKEMFSEVEICNNPPKNVTID
jgi:hypothetical protein